LTGVSSLTVSLLLAKLPCRRLRSQFLAKVGEFLHAVSDVHRAAHAERTDSREELEGLLALLSRLDYNGYFAREREQAAAAKAASGGGDGSGGGHGDIAGLAGLPDGGLAAAGLTTAGTQRMTVQFGALVP
jgi:hypothetical protein